jgi:MFS transporter, OPA family, glycerol-3-phosphate transporter
MFSFFKPAPHIARLPVERIRERYAHLRWQILESTFIGYAFFYLVRNNLAPVSKEMAAAVGYTKSEIGDFLAATAIAYGVGKFLMGLISDRSNPRAFMPLGLVLTALCNFAFGGTANYHLHLALWTLNGLVQGMGWPPCGRSLGHWFSENERGMKFAIWNIAHNVGGGIAGVVAAESMNLFGWRYAFYIPGILALACAAYLYARLRDTPQSEGLPPIEEYRHDYPAMQREDHERELGTRELFIHYVLKNKYLWIFAIANFFVYIARYSMLDWGPTYLKEAKGANILEGGMSTMYLEFAGIPSTILMGWISDKIGGRRGLMSFLCMIPVFFAFTGIALLPPGHLALDMALFGVVGFFVYPPVMLLGVTGLDFTSKKAVGTAAGFIGLFGYLGRTAQGKILGVIADTNGWDASLALILGSTFIAIVLLAFTIRLRPRG